MARRRILVTGPSRFATTPERSGKSESFAVLPEAQGQQVQLDVSEGINCCGLVGFTLRALGSLLSCSRMWCSSQNTPSG